MGRTSFARGRSRQAPVMESTPLRKPQHDEAEDEEDQFSPRQPFVEEDQSMDQEDAGSVPTASAVQAFDGPGGYSYFSLPLHRATAPELQSKEFVIPRTPAEIAAATAEAAEAAENALHEMQQDDYEDDISILTEFSGMDEEEDASSQVTAGTETRTVVTTTTGSTTIPTRNAGDLGISSNSHYTMNKRRNAVVDANHGLPPLDNSHSKRLRLL